MPTYDFSQPIDLNALPASVLLAMEKDPASSMPGAPPNFGMDVVPHYFTTTGYVGSAARAYPIEDEATRNSVENAERMRTECAIMECLESRQRATALLGYHIVPEDERSSRQQELCRELTRIISRIPRFVEYRRCLLEALWYGKYAVVNRFGQDKVGGHYRTIVKDWAPRHGDKLLFRYSDDTQRFVEGQLGIRVHANFAATQETRFPGPNSQWRKRIEPTQYGLCYWFNDWERATMVVHKHMIEDGPWHDPRMMGRVMGVGIRDRIYWTWYAMQALLQDLLTYSNRAALGVRLWRYPSGNDEWKSKVESAAKSAIANGVADILFPVEPNDYASLYGVEQIEPGTAGAQLLAELIERFFLKKIKKYILGQLLTSEAEATGLGSGVAQAHLATFSDIVQYDASNLQETLTEQLVRKIQKENAPKSMGVYVRMVLDTDTPDTEKRLAAIQAAYQMDVPIKIEDIYQLTGLTKPQIGDATVSVSLQQEKQQRQQNQMMMEQQAMMAASQGAEAGGMEGQGGPPPEEMPPEEEQPEQATMDVSPENVEETQGPTVPANGQLEEKAALDQPAQGSPWNGFWESLFDTIRGQSAEVPPEDEEPERYDDDSLDEQTAVIQEMIDDYIYHQQSVDDFKADLANALEEQWQLSEDLTETFNRQGLTDRLNKAIDFQTLTQSIEREFDSTYLRDSLTALLAQRMVPQAHTDARQSLLDALNKQFGYAAVERYSHAWTPYKGPRGGKGWRKAVSGEVRYQEKSPDRDPKPDTELHHHRWKKNGNGSTPRIPKMEREEPYVGFDLDGTLARDEGWKGPEHIGEPIPRMIAKVKWFLHKGVQVRIITARLGLPGKEAETAHRAIKRWCKKHIGQLLKVQAHKTPGLVKLYDDKAEQVEKNTGKVESHEEYSAPSGWGNVEPSVTPNVNPLRGPKAAPLPMPKLSGVSEEQAKPAWETVSARYPKIASHIKEIRGGEFSAPGLEGAAKPVGMYAPGGTISVPGDRPVSQGMLFHEITHAAQDMRGKLRPRSELSLSEYESIETPAHARGKAGAASTDEYCMKSCDKYTCTAAEIDEAIQSWSPPTEGQIEAGNYLKPRIRLHGMEIAIENPKGTRRRPECPELCCHYGYISRIGNQSTSEARDGDKVDVFVGHKPSSEIVFVIDQETLAGTFDEHKVIMAATNEDEARKLYLANYTSGWRCGPITSMTIPQFKAWLDCGDLTKRVAKQVSKYMARYEAEPERYAGYTHQFGPKFGTSIPESEATELVGSIRRGDSRSKNRGEPSGQPKTGDLVHSAIPTSLFGSEPYDEEGTYVDFLRRTTDPHRVAEYAKQKIETPIYVRGGRTNTPRISDGGHRFLAAIDRGDEWIPALVPPDLHGSIHSSPDKYARKMKFDPRQRGFDFDAPKPLPAAAPSAPAVAPSAPAAGQSEAGSPWVRMQGERGSTYWYNRVTNPNNDPGGRKYQEEKPGDDDTGEQDATATAKPSDSTEKEFWQMTKQEATAAGYGDNWSSIVSRAIDQGKPVPDNVKEEYDEHRKAYEARFNKPDPNKLPKAKIGDKIIRYVHKDGTGLLNNTGLDRSKLSDAEEEELMRVMDFGLRQPPHGTTGTFYFTEAGEKKHAKMLRLLKKASKTGVVRKVTTLQSEPSWQSNDGQIAVDEPSPAGAMKKQKERDSADAETKEPWQMTWDEIKASHAAQREAMPGIIESAEAQYAEARKSFDTERTKLSKRLKAINKRMERLNPTGDIENVDSASKRTIADLETERESLVSKMRSAEAPIRQSFVESEINAKFPNRQSIPHGQHQHMSLIQEALAAGKDVPADVLEAYPDLQKAQGAGKQTPTSPDETTQLLDQAAPYTEFGENYSRNIAEAVNDLKLAMSRKDGAKFIPHLTETLKMRLEAAQPKQRHVAVYNGKEVEADNFKQAAQRVADNLRAGEHGYVRSPDGKLHEISRDKKTAVPVEKMRTTRERDIALLEDRIKKPMSTREKETLTRRLEELRAQPDRHTLTPEVAAKHLYSLAHDMFAAYYGGTA